MRASGSGVLDPDPWHLSCVHRTLASASWWAEGGRWFGWINMSEDWRHLNLPQERRPLMILSRSTPCPFCSFHGLIFSSGWASLDKLGLRSWVQVTPLQPSRQPSCRSCRHAAPVPGKSAGGRVGRQGGEASHSTSWAPSFATGIRWAARRGAGSLASPTLALFFLLLARQTTLFVTRNQVSFSSWNFLVWKL